MDISKKPRMKFLIRKTRSMTLSWTRCYLITTVARARTSAWALNSTNWPRIFTNIWIKTIKIIFLKGLKIWQWTNSQKSIQSWIKSGGLELLTFTQRSQTPKIKISISRTKARNWRIRSTQTTSLLNLKFSWTIQRLTSQQNKWINITKS